MSACLTFLDLLTEPALLKRARDEFTERTGGGIGETQWVAPLLPKDFAPPIDLRWPEYIKTARGEEWWIPTPATGSGAGEPARCPSPQAWISAPDPGPLLRPDGGETGRSRLDDALAERDESLERETATAEVLGVINSSPGDLDPVFGRYSRDRAPAAVFDCPGSCRTPSELLTKVHER